MIDDEVLPAGDDGDYVLGGPEFVLEVARSTAAVDLGGKLADYLAAGVREYVVVLERESRVAWFDLSVGDRELPAPPDGVLRSRIMPGLWLAGSALLRGGRSAAKKVLEQGLASPEHAAFVRRLAAAHAAHLSDAAARGGP